MREKGVNDPDCLQRENRRGRRRQQNNGCERENLGNQILEWMMSKAGGKIYLRIGMVYLMHSPENRDRVQDAVFGVAEQIQQQNAEHHSRRQRERDYVEQPEAAVLYRQR